MVDSLAIKNIPLVLERSTKPAIKKGGWSQLKNDFAQNPNEKVFVINSQELPEASRPSDDKRYSDAIDYLQKLSLGFITAVGSYNYGSKEKKQDHLIKAKIYLDQILTLCADKNDPTKMNWNKVLTYIQCFKDGKYSVYKITNILTRKEHYVLLLGKPEESHINAYPLDKNCIDGNDYTVFYDVMRADYKSHQEFFSTIKGCVTIQQVYTDDGNVPKDNMVDMYFYPYRPAVYKTPTTSRSECFQGILGK